MISLEVNSLKQLVILATVLFLDGVEKRLREQEK